MGKRKEKKVRFITKDELKIIMEADIQRILADEKNPDEQTILNKFEGIYSQVCDLIDDIAIHSLKTYLAFAVYPYLNSGGILKYNFNYRTFTDPKFINEYRNQDMYVINIKATINEALDDINMIDKTNIPTIVEKTHEILSFEEHRNKCPKYNIYSNPRNRCDYTICSNCLLKTNSKRLGHGLECSTNIFYKY